MNHNVMVAPVGIRTEALRNLHPPNNLNPYTPNQQEQFIEEAKISVQQAIDRDIDLASSVEALKIGDISYLHISSAVPADEISFRHEFVLAGMAELFGKIIGYKVEYQGNIFHHLVPDEEHADEQSSLGYANELSAHRDVEHIPDPGNPNYLCLLCRVPAPSAHTIIYPNERIIEKLDEHTQNVLQTEFPFIPPATFGNGELTMLPILTQEGYHSSIRWGNILESALSDESTEAYMKLKSAIRQVRNESAQIICLQTGDLLLFNNHRILHGRTRFKLDKNCRRHLIRCYVVSDFEGMRSRFHMHGRILV